jgi:hypothetical protein
VRDGNDVHVVGKHPVDDEEGVAMAHEPASAVEVGRPALRRRGDLLERSGELVQELVRSPQGSLRVSVARALGLGDGGFLEGDPLRTHSRVRRSVFALAPRARGG